MEETQSSIEESAKLERIPEVDVRPAIILGRGERNTNQAKFSVFVFPYYQNQSRAFGYSRIDIPKKDIMVRKSIK